MKWYHIAGWCILAVAATSVFAAVLYGIYEEEGWAGIAGVAAGLVVLAACFMVATP